VVETGAAGGVMVTASHNPAAYNGFKICGAGAVPVGEASGLREIERLAGEAASEPRAPAAPAPGEVSVRDVAESYAAQALSIARPQKRHRIVVDAGNGMAAAGLEPVLEFLDLDVIRLFYEPDGRFPNHPADPLRAENLVDLQRTVVAEGADLGVAFDGDADRAVFVDEHGEVVSADLATGLLATAQLRQHPGGLVLFDLRSSWATGEAIRAAGGDAQICRVGHSFVKAHMRESGAVFAGELSGHYYFRFANGLIADDAVAAVVCLLAVLDEGQTLSERVAPLRRYFATGELNREVADPQALIEEVAAEHRDAPEVSRLDGLLVRYDDWWFNLRPSNTEPVLRLNLEARSAARMAEERDRLLARIDRASG
ncbi:MAG: phosphomannomutase/phosphoglucomutase, partial [Myxococcales bacterium]|nr:phosphomannomutase/phosphoglucomutase [Myxococcales bacterium]